MNGDAASREGLAEDYQELKALLEPVSRAAPVYIGLGNHDDRENFKAAFAPAAGVDAGVSKRHVLIIEEPLVRFIVLDSLLYVNKSAGWLGELGRAQLLEPTYFFNGRKRAWAPPAYANRHVLARSDEELVCASLAAKEAK